MLKDSQAVEEGAKRSPTVQGVEKGSDARRRPMTGREAYSVYVERPVEGANEADGPLSAPWPQAVEKGSDARRRPKTRREAYSVYVERPVEGANEADGPLSAAC